MPAATRQKVLAATRAVMHDPQVVERLQSQAFDVVNSSPEEFTVKGVRLL